jgi:hypothetical protein
MIKINGREPDSPLEYIHALMNPKSPQKAQTGKAKNPMNWRPIWEKGEDKKRRERR